MCPCLIYKKSVPSYASAAEAATKLNTVHRVKIDPLSLMSLLSFGIHARKKFHPALLLLSLTDVYEASEWRFNIMSDA